MKKNGTEYILWTKQYMLRSCYKPPSKEFSCGVFWWCFGLVGSSAWFFVCDWFSEPCCDFGRDFLFQFPTQIPPPSSTSWSSSSSLFFSTKPLLPLTKNKLSCLMNWVLYHTTTITYSLFLLFVVAVVVCSATTIIIKIIPCFKRRK